MSNVPRIYVDFLHTGGRANQVVLSRMGTMRDLERFGIVLSEGLVLHLYSDDLDDLGQPDNLVVEAVAHYDEAHKQWVATYDDAALMHESDLKDEEQTSLNSARQGSTARLSGSVSYWVGVPFGERLVAHAECPF